MITFYPHFNPPTLFQAPKESRRERVASEREIEKELMELIPVSDEALLESLTLRGWHFRDHGETISLIRSKNPSFAALPLSLLVDSVESELLNMDLKFFGGKSLPEPSTANKKSYLHGPKVLQLVSLRDIRQSIIDASFKGLQHQHRLLRFILTDGLTETSAVEYTPIPRITEEIIPGCKVRLENKISIHYSILCLNAGDITIIGGLVQSLHDEWQMNRRYLGIAHSLMTRTRNDDGDGPPPFEKLQSKAQPRRVSAFSGSRDQLEAKKLNAAADDPKLVCSTMRNEEKTSGMASRPKEAIEAVPVQNQAAAQKLLQKLCQPMQQGRNPRGHKARFKDKREEEGAVFTLDEWERWKASTSNSMSVGNAQDLSRDEILARKLQTQLDMEDYQNDTGNSGCEAEQIRMSMFSYGGTGETRNEGRSDARGRRGRGRGRARKRFS